MRWKCPHCEHFVNYGDLEYCALTEEALCRFGDKVGLDHHMVELREDRSMHLLTETASRPERKSSGSNSQSAGQRISFAVTKGDPSAPSAGEVEVIEID
jgi:hypothetical protein